MTSETLGIRSLAVLAGLLFAPASSIVAQGPFRAFPSPETLTYSIEWRLIPAGAAKLSLTPAKVDGKDGWQSNLHIESTGLVSRFYHIDDTYSVSLENQFCAVSSSLNAVEGKRRRETTITFDHAAGKARYVEKDLTKNAVTNKEVDIPACVHDVIGALQALRGLHLEPKQSAQLPVSDGKKSVSVRLEAQEREVIRTASGSYQTIRYEAFLFDNVLFQRKGRMYVWISDDVRRLPVQIRARLQFAIGTITLQLEKEEHS